MKGEYLVTDTVRIPLMDLQAQYDSIREQVEPAVHSVLESGTFILGPNVEAFEGELAQYLGTRHAIGVASGTDALLLTLRALGVGPGDEVIVPAFTFFATAEVVLLLGATPVLVDITPDTYCMDVNLLERSIGPRTKAILPVHLFGHPADMDPTLEAAQRHGLPVVEDNAQAIGARYKSRMTGSLGDAGCLSFYPSKNLGAYGDAGMVVTNDDHLAEQIRMLRTHGWNRKYYSEIAGYNSRLDELQAAILRIKLRHLNSWNEARRRWATGYTEALASTDIGLPTEMEYAHHVYHLYVIQVSERDRVAQELSQVGVSTSVYYPYPLHLMPSTQDLGYQKGDFPVSEAASEQLLAIPLYPEMSVEQVKLVVESIESAVSGSVVGKS